MKYMAVICEYNPFHNGHAYQLREQKKQLGCDGVICLMSGSFVQRGEPAICDKWARAEMALAGGADLVLELPVLYSLQSAEGFAWGAVSLLTKLGFDGYLCFGSESGDISALEKGAALTDTEDYHKAVRSFLESGISYPKACATAAESLMADGTGVVFGPNDILGIEYIRALQKSASKLKAKVLHRTSGMHDAEEADGNFLSATGIRKRMLSGQEIASFVPKATYDVLQHETIKGRAPVTNEALDMILCYALNRMSREELSQISGVSEGFENRLLEAAGDCRSFEEIAEYAKTKRYPYTRICRVLIKALLGITHNDEAIMPSYARILGIGPLGGTVLRQLQKTAAIPLITKTADAVLTGDDAKRLFSLDIAATDLYSLLYPQKNTGKSGMDFYRSPVICLGHE